MKKIMLPFTLLFAFPILAQEVLKLEWIVDVVVERNPQIKFLREQIEAQKFRIAPEKALPDLVLGLSIKNIGLDRFTLGREEMSGFGFVFSQKIPLAFAAIVAITVAPALTILLVRGKIYQEEKHPVSKFLFRIYEPVIHFILMRPLLFVIIAFLLILTIMPLWRKPGSEFKPPLNDGSILYMPTLPGISVTETARILQLQDEIFKTFPEVERGLGKAGRALTATDPVSFSMKETKIILKPQNEWRKEERWYSNIIPEFLPGQNLMAYMEKMLWIKPLGFLLLLMHGQCQ